ncbi:2-dehydro-3-deoxy-phosphogluconate aldolase [Notoacmeibacter sp. MSK16QG-6]|uniref:2-dehydro-3-deoxy-phosphogluconate aldolase n=1 Tax=Notoacmeibacter sp. MSK16QG-6 TaxID=2957982 RepID=UPI0020A07D92|nr:2-dehydro-3-deoxy-phosphogluconate aldolase [Notoacmeibacter sp. MSK16QG-6]MCP1200372.1 2-dehydro-3-deoxy-phosphogluconate aldolase [Notoacmeibacter sp. MSK16QG-6]
MQQKTEALSKVLTGQPVIPVVQITNLSHAVPMAKALVAGGLPAIEITLRTDEALDAIRLVANEVEGAIVGAGTVLNPKQFKDAQAAGSQFIVSPGTTVELLNEAKDHMVPYLPGATTPSEIMSMIEEGYSVLKFFPAEQSGGMAYLKSLSSPLAGVSFCPTGGITPQSAPDYLALPNVLCVGGSWVTPNDVMDAGDWDRIEQLAREASGLRQG